MHCEKIEIVSAVLVVNLLHHNLAALDLGTGDYCVTGMQSMVFWGEYFVT